MSKIGKIKSRSSITYNRKVSRIKTWYGQREKYRKLHEAELEKLKDKQNLTDKEKIVLKKKYEELKPLSFYIDQIKKPVGK